MTDIRALARQISPPNACWIGPDDTGEDFCPECAEKRVAGTKNFVDGGWSCQSESDGCRHCADCGQLLTYSLSKCGLEEEVEHFAMCGVPAHPSPETAYHLVAIEDAFACYGGDWPTL